ncbi:MAG: cyclic nucleotide-binding domain-containing protein [Myxococcales bacterium]|nr:cyclic nucleotide-binding domain-containing protein [Myxococcales bacterium]MCA9567623.1 cyclic nucleotide-binding domain-containing protein [Myxococcales bacterium]MCB9671227.1 cyclic nucleotide-binding domain-containing protein [Alphaproteobacteria bacterium]
MSAELLTQAAEEARRHHAGLKPFLQPGEPLRRAGRHVSEESTSPARPIVGPTSTDRDLRFLVSGKAVVTRAYGEEKPQSVRNLAAPTSFGASTFALGIDRSASVVAMTPCTTLRLSPRGLKELARDSPTIAVGLLRWASLDLVDWLRASRMGTDVWSARNAPRGDTERAFRATEPGRTPLEIDGSSHGAVMDALAELPFLDGASMLPLADALGHHVHLAMVPRGEAAVAHEERDGSLYVLLDGEAEVIGRTGTLLGRFRSGGPAHEVLIGEVAFLAQGGRNGTVTARTDCLLLEIPRTSVGWMTTRHGALAVALHMALLRTLCWRLRETDETRDAWVSGAHPVR